MLTVGCFNGVCDTATGQCFAQPIMPGQQCAEATDQCNVGICDMSGNCNGTPANQGMPCNDGSGCTSGETCNNGNCTGGTQTTTCITGDLCCPQNCNINNDGDCNTSCLAILQNNPTAPDGPYQILENSVFVNVYCDMTHGGDTYRTLAMGDYTQTYPGYSLVTLADLGDSVIQQAFIYLYNQQGSALINLNPGWNSGNCCIKLADHVSTGGYLTLGGSYLYPASVMNTEECNTGYFDPTYRFEQANLFVFSPVPMLSSYFQQNPPGTTNVCGDSNNPAWFWKKF
jgi:hypothetical protein